MNFGFNKKSTTDIGDLNTQLKDVNLKLESISPLVKSIYSNAALHWLGKGMDVMVEFSMYIIGLACLGFIFVMNTVFPFHVLGEIVTKDVFKQAITNAGDMEMFNMAVKGLVAIIGILFIMMGMMKNSASKRKSLLQKSGLELKAIEATLLAQKARIEKELPQATTQVANELKVVEPHSFPPTNS